MELRKTWSPSTLGRFFTRSPRWVFNQEDDQFTLDIEGRIRRGSVLELEQLTQEPGLLWATVHIPVQDGSPVRLHGIPNAVAEDLKRRVASRVALPRTTFPA